MQAAVIDCQVGYEAFDLREFDPPKLVDKRLLIQTQVTGVNRIDGRRTRWESW